MGDSEGRLAKVSPRITYVILCWDDNLRGNLFKQVRPDAILGPFTEWEATRVAATLTCECEVTNVTTEAPPWATESPEPPPWVTRLGTGTPI